MRTCEKIITDKIEDIEGTIRQYIDGLITGPEALFSIAGIVDDPVITIIHEHDTAYTALCNKTTTAIRAKSENCSTCNQPLDIMLCVNKDCAVYMESLT